MDVQIGDAVGRTTRLNRWFFSRPGLWRNMYDLIGDIHGHADALVQLLEKLGYDRDDQGVFQHPDRKVIFLGDFIDRGLQIRQVLEIVKSMIDHGKALAVMGNHELNALAYHTQDPEQPGEFLRTHTPKNTKQHHQTLEQLTPEQLAGYLAWFRKLPMWLDLDGLRVVHACWDDKAIKMVADGLQAHGSVTSAFLQEACKKGRTLYAPVDIILKGKEAALPQGASFTDKDGNIRTETRTRWYLPPEGHTHGTYALQSDPIHCNEPLTPAVVQAAAPYPTDAKPVFIGHYWLWAGHPEILARNVACLDYSVAKEGFLCAYRWNGERKLNNDHFLRHDSVV
jgi:hypothetical protein